MMPSPSHLVPILTTFLILSTPNIITTTISSSSSSSSSSSLLDEACERTSHVDYCLQLLQSDKKISSAATLLDLSVAIMESGISNATGTHAYIGDKLRETSLAPDIRGALRVCNSSYSSAIGSLSSALGEVGKTKEYQSASHDLAMASKEAMQPCLKALAAKEIEDDIIFNGNKALEMFASSANNVVDVLYGQSMERSEL